MELIEYILVQNTKFNYCVLIKSNSNTNNLIKLFYLFNVKRIKLIGSLLKSITIR